MPLENILDHNLTLLLNDDLQGALLDIQEHGVISARRMIRLQLLLRDVSNYLNANYTKKFNALRAHVNNRSITIINNPEFLQPDHNFRYEYERRRNAIKMYLTAIIAITKEEQFLPDNLLLALYRLNNEGLNLLQKFSPKKYADMRKNLLYGVDEAIEYMKSRLVEIKEAVSQNPPSKKLKLDS